MVQSARSSICHLRDLAVATRGPAPSRALGVNGVTSLVNALGTALALAGGITFGEYVMSVLWRQLRLVENRFFAPLFAEPFAAQHRKSGRGKDEKIASD